MAVLCPLARTCGLPLDWRPEADRAVACLNPMLLGRVVQNLVDNAVKYTPAGRVEVSVEAREGQVWIYVADIGVGIDAAFVPRLFTPFARERARAGAPEGAGLGLAITRSLVERMGGQMFACSVKGEGATFTVRFPLATPPEGEAGNAKREARPGHPHVSASGALRFRGSLFQGSDTESAP